MSKRIIIIGIVIITVIAAVLVIGNNVLFTTDDAKITDDYIVVFHGGASEVTYQTYVYKKGLRYKYINTQESGMTSKDREEVILNVGKINNFDEIYEIIEGNGSNSFATLPNDDKVYQISEIKDILK